MAGELAKKTSFEDRMKERIKDSIGELLTDEELNKLITRGIEDNLFQPRIVNDLSSGYSKTITKEPLLQEIVRPLVTEYVQKAVTAWAKENGSKIGEIIEEQVSRGAGDALLRAVGRALDYRFESFERDLAKSIKDGTLF